LSPALLDLVFRYSATISSTYFSTSTRCSHNSQASKTKTVMGAATAQKTQNCDETDMWRSSALIEMKGDMTVCKHPLAREGAELVWARHINILQEGI
jgi:hypothetical protein